MERIQEQIVELIEVLPTGACATANRNTKCSRACPSNPGAEVPSPVW